MSRVTACEYKLPENDDYRCAHAPLSKAHRLCVFHIPKQSETDEGGEPYGMGYQQLVGEFRERFASWVGDHFEGTTEYIDLRGFEFPKYRFDPVALPKKANFEYAVFNGEIAFNIALPKPNPENEYDTHEFSLLRQGASFEHAHFKGNAAFGGCLVDGEFNFRSAVFDGNAVFAGTAIKNCDFSDAVFNNEADFSQASIKYAMFYGVQFVGNTDFSTFIAQEGAFFDRAEFHKPTEFWRCHFGTDNEPLNGETEKASVAEPGVSENTTRPASETDGAISAEAKTSEDPTRWETSFCYSTFHDTVNFSETFFNSGAEFDSATFRKRALFLGDRSNLFSEGAVFSNVILPKDEELIFEQVDLSKTRFHDTYLDKVVFRDVVWGNTTGRIRRFFRGNSYVLWDEVRPLEGMSDYLDDAKTADNYRQLVINYEKKRDYETAEAFHVSEMEMRRRGVGDAVSGSIDEPGKVWRVLHRNLKLYLLVNLWARLRKYINGYSLYWISSRYGTSYRHAVIVLVLMLFAFSILFLYSGLTPTPENKLEDARAIEYNLFPDDSHPPAEINQQLFDWRESFFYTLEIATFQKEKFYQPISWQGRALVYPAVILLAGQAALLLLSIRRRFRRE